MNARVMIVVTHLLGTGHLSRALTLARSFAASGHDTHVVSGGLPAPQLDASGVTFHQLPPLRSDGTNFSRLLTADGHEATASDFSVRIRMLLDLLRTITPDILITELFPFGRRNLREEFSAVLESAQCMNPRPRMLASIRDILAPPSKPSKATFADDMVDQFYDAVLFHSDPSVIPLDISWPVSPILAQKLRFTGFVAPPMPTVKDPRGGGEVLVSAGGGSVGGSVFRAAVEAARNSTLTWRLLVGGQDADARIAALVRHSPPNAIVEGTRPDFRSMLRNAAASVSLCGYNTAMDILQNGLPSVFVPFDEGGEVEQGLRAKALSHLSGIDVLKMGDLDGASLRTAVERVRSAPPRDTTGYCFDGARETVRICMELLS